MKDFGPRVKRGKTVYSYYILDGLTVGHLNFMENAWRLAGPGGKAIVGILIDEAVMEKGSKPTMPFSERVQIARGLRFSDLVVPQEKNSPIVNIERFRPDIVVESSDHNRQDIETVREATQKIGAKLIILPYFPKQINEVAQQLDIDYERPKAPEGKETL